MNYGWLEEIQQIDGYLSWSIWAICVYIELAHISISVWSVHHELIATQNISFGFSFIYVVV